MKIKQFAKFAKFEKFEKCLKFVTLNKFQFSKCAIFKQNYYIINNKI